MKLLCATDFSDSSRIAGRAAARLAARLGGKLHLVHVAHLPGTHLGTSATPFSVSKEEMARRERILVEQADELRQLGASVTTTLLEGLPDERLLEHGEELAADAFAIGPRGDRREADWSLGSVAMRVIKGAHVPVFVFREDQSLAQWVAGSRALRVMVGTDPGKPEQAAIGWLAEWMHAGPVELVCGHVYQPGEERSHAGAPQREAALAAAIVERTSRWPELGTPRVRILAGFGRASEHVLDLAASENSDLIVVGTHRRSLVGRWLHGSVSLDLVASAKRNVVTVPLVAQLPKQRAPGAIRHVLVPTDLSDLSARAIHWANTILPAGGTLQLLHVIAPYIPASVDFGTYVPVPAPTREEEERERAAIEQKLAALVPANLAERGVEVQFEVVTGFNPAEMISQAAERLESDVICLSTHGRSGISKAILGSVAEALLRRATVPVLIVPPHWMQ